MKVRFKYLLVGYIAVFIALSFIFSRDYLYIREVDLVYILMIFILAFLPALVFVLNKSESRLIPLMPLHGIFYAAVMGWPALSNKTVWLSGNSESITESLAVVCLALFFLNLGYYLTKYYIKERRSSFKFLLSISPIRELIIGWILFLIYLLFIIFPQLSEIPSVQHIAMVALYLSLGILFNAWVKNRLSKTQKGLYIIAFSFAILTIVFVGSLAKAVFLFTFIGIIYWREKQSIPWSFCIMILLIVVALNPVKHVYRSVINNEIVENLSFTEKSVLFVNSIEVFFDSGRSVFSIINTDKSAVNRLAHISTLSRVVEKTPDIIPYWGGETYLPLGTFFIPRILWADKPSENSGQTFGHRYSFLNTHDVTTSYNMPWLTELYANFGIIGVILGMFSIGLFFRFLVSQLSVYSPNGIEFVAGLSVTFELFFADSNFSLIANGVFLKYLLCLLLLRILTLKFKLGSVKTIAE